MPCVCARVCVYQSCCTGRYRTLSTFPWLFSVVIFLVLVAYNVRVSSQGQGWKKLVPGKRKIKGRKRPIFIC
jgi:hypothetical protein